MRLFTPAPDARLRIVLYVIKRRGCEGVAGVLSRNLRTTALVSDMNRGGGAPLGNLVAQLADQSARGGEGQMAANRRRRARLFVAVEGAAEHQLSWATVGATET